jgi:radical SAM superfamily enzyme YgiQ (UPF0313 family)
MKKIQVFSTQFNYQYGNVIHFPYSIASLVAYIKSFENLANNFEFQKTFVFRNKFDDYVNRCRNVDILLCSCYTWNWEITCRIAKIVKEKNPNSLIIFGGPQVPLQYEGDVPTKWVENSKGNFFDDYPYVDILVHQEGELTVKDIFEKFVGDKNFGNIKGIETKLFRTEPQDRIMDLNILPSPYLTNLVWDLVESEKDVSYIASLETNRGCPFECTFCDWGSSTKSKVRKRNIDIILKEIEWFADNKIPYVDICDANFGIFADRDLEIAKKFSAEKKLKGFPGRVGIAWAKASSERVIQIARELLDADLLRAVTLAVQSLDPSTLNIIKRANIKFDKFSNLLHQFRSNKIENYTEIIMGMPGETLESYKAGLEQLMELFPRPVIFIYNCGVFVNAPMNKPSYIEAHGIKVIKSPIYLWHSSIYNRGNIPEYDNITISANTFSEDDLRLMFIHGWAAQAFHSLGILEYIAKFYNTTYRLKFIPFYEKFIEYCQSSSGLFNNEYKILINYLEVGYSGKGWDHYDPNLAPIYWPIEEATWLRCVTDSSVLQDEILSFLGWFEKDLGFSSETSIIQDLVKFQIFILSTMDNKDSIKSHLFKYDWRDFLVNNRSNINQLVHGPKKYSWKNKVTLEDKAEWCYRAVWVGRNQGNYKCHPEFLEDEKLLEV